LDDAAYLALGKSPKYAVHPVMLSIEDILSGVETVIGALLEEAAEEARNLKDNLGQES
jgi:hypothetical protein